MSDQKNEDFAKAHPLLTHMTIEEVFIAAERWQALTSRDVDFPMMAAQGFTEGEQQADPNTRSLTLTLNLRPSSDVVDLHPGKVYAHEEAVYKLTDMADLVRARALEDSQS